MSRKRIDVFPIPWMDRQSHRRSRLRTLNPNLSGDSWGLTRNYRAIVAAGTRSFDDLNELLIPPVAGFKARSKRAGIDNDLRSLVRQRRGDRDPQWYRTGTIEPSLWPAPAPRKPRGRFLRPGERCQYYSRHRIARRVPLDRQPRGRPVLRAFGSAWIISAYPIARGLRHGIQDQRRGDDVPWQILLGEDLTRSARFSPSCPQ
jgi:hypothetical protein